MTNEILEMPEDLFNLAKDGLEKLSSFLENLNLDLHGGNSVRKAAAAVMIHILMKFLSEKQNFDSFLKGDSNELGTLENPLPAKKYKKAETVYLSKEEDKEND